MPIRHIEQPDTGCRRGHLKRSQKIEELMPLLDHFHGAQEGEYPSHQRVLERGLEAKEELFVKILDDMD